MKKNPDLKIIFQKFKEMKMNWFKTHNNDKKAWRKFGKKETKKQWKEENKEALSKMKKIVKFMMLPKRVKRAIAHLKEEITTENQTDITEEVFTTVSTDNSKASYTNEEVATIVKS